VAVAVSVLRTWKFIVERRRIITMGHHE